MIQRLTALCVGAGLMLAASVAGAQQPGSPIGEPVVSINSSPAASGAGQPQATAGQVNPAAPVSARPSPRFRVRFIPYEFARPAPPETRPLVRTNDGAGFKLNGEYLSRMASMFATTADYANRGRADNETRPSLSNSGGPWFHHLLCHVLAAKKWVMVELPNGDKEWGVEYIGVKQGRVIKYKVKSPTGVVTEETRVVSWSADKPRFEARLAYMDENYTLQDISFIEAKRRDIKRTTVAFAEGSSELDTFVDEAMGGGNKRAAQGDTWFWYEMIGGRGGRTAETGDFSSYRLGRMPADQLSLGPVKSDEYRRQGLDLASNPRHLVMGPGLGSAIFALGQMLTVRPGDEVLLPTIARMRANQSGDDGFGHYGVAKEMVKTGIISEADLNRRVVAKVIPGGYAVDSEDVSSQVYDQDGRPQPTGTQKQLLQGLATPDGKQSYLYGISNVLGSARNPDSEAAPAGVTTIYGFKRKKEAWHQTFEGLANPGSTATGGQPNAASPSTGVSSEGF